MTRKKPVDAIRDKLVDAKSSTTYSRPVSLRKKELDSSKNVRYLYAAGELKGGQRRATDPIWSLRASLFFTTRRIDQRVVLSEKSYSVFLLEMSDLLKEFIHLKKKRISFSTDPSNPVESIQETDKDMNSEKIINLANPNDH